MKTCGHHPWDSFNCTSLLDRLFSLPPGILALLRIGPARACTLRVMCLALVLCARQHSLGEELGIFEKQADIGQTSKAGSVVFDSANHSYVVAGGGENMWATNDAFHFVWMQVSNNFSLKAAIEWLGTGGNPHRKACLLIRQSLSPDSPYVDIAVHGVGLTSLQYREKPGGVTREIQANVSAPTRVAIQRQGEVFFTSIASGTGPLEPNGCFMRLALTDPLYVGLAVCAHDDQVLEKARFSQVEFVRRPAQPARPPILHCSLEAVPVASKDRRVIYHTLDRIEAPNWSRDGNIFLFNSAGHLFRLPKTGGKPELLDTAFAQYCISDHGFSPDGSRLAITDQSRGGQTLIYLMPASGGTPHQVTQLGPSYWHGWSPDGATLSYCAGRNGDLDVYTIPIEGGEEKRLTTAKGVDDGPEYSPDGKYIYFSSERSGSMQIWRMQPDGSGQEQVTFDDYNNWFPHPSPDGRWLVFLSYEKAVTGHPANQPIRLRLMPTLGGAIQELARLFGGQGTINVPSWSPDSREVAFISYELISPEP